MMKIVSRIVFFIVLLMFFKFGSSQNSFIKELQKGDVYSNSHDFENAIIHFQNYLNQSKTLGKYRNFETEANVNRKLAYAYSTSGKYLKTFDHLQEALRLDSTENNRLAYAEDIRLLGMAYAYSNNYEKAMFHLEKAIGLTEQLGKSIKEDKLRTLANTYLSASQIHATLGDFSSSSEYVSKSLNLFHKIRDEYGLAQALNHLAWLQVEEGNYKEAEKNLNKSIAYYNKLKLFTFEQYNAISDISEKENKYEDALRYRLIALAQADSSKILPQIIWSTIRVGDAYKVLGMEDKAKNYYMQALKLNNELNQSNLTPAIDYRLGNIIGANQSYLKNKIKYGSGISALKIGEMFQNDKPDSALYYYNQSLCIFKNFKNKEYINKVLLQISDLYINQGKNVDALALLLPISESTSNLETIWQSSFFIAKAYENLNKDSLAIIHYKNAIHVIENLRRTIVLDEFRDSYFSDKVVVYDKLIQLLQSNGKTKEAWSYSEQARARSFLDMVEGGKIGESQLADSALIRREQKLKSEISFLLRTIQSENLNSDSTRSASPALDKKLKGKEAEYYAVVEQLKLFKSKYIQLISAETLDISQLQKRIKEDRTIVEYWCGEKKLQIYVITRDTFIARTVTIDDFELKNKIEICRNAISKSGDSGKVYLSELYDILWKPVEHDISPNQKICIIPHQYLHYVPFAALYKDKYLVEKYFIKNSVSASLYKNELLDDSEDSFLGIALRKSNIGNFQPLSNTEQEVKLIQQYFSKSTLAIEDHSNESFIKESIPKASVIHFATHGVYDEQQPLNSYLLLNSDVQNDGRLTVYEIFNSNIQAKLTTLSACQTAVGKLSQGDEIVGLTRAFLYAGSSNVISSLWNISDVSTPKLINDLYSFYSQKNSFNEALCMAQRKFINNTSSDPRLWSAFVLYN